MILPPRELLPRLLVWSGLFVWALWRMHQASTLDVLGPDILGAGVPDAGNPGSAPAAASVPRVLALLNPAPAPLALSTGSPLPDVMDPEAALNAVAAAASSAQSCGSNRTFGTLGVRLGPSGLASAWVTDGWVTLGDDADPLDGAGAVSVAAAACVATAVWAVEWPRTRLEFEMEQEFGR